MVRNIFLFSLWGCWVLHCQIVVCAFLTTWLPQGAGWNVAFFFLFLIVMAVNIGMNYLWAVSKWFGDETVMDAFIVGVALLALMTFVASALGVKLHYHYHAQFTDVETVENCPTHLKTGGFYRFPNAVIAHSFTYQDRWKHYAQTKGQSPKGYFVAYKITPLRCDSNTVYQWFIGYNNRDESLQSFDNQSVMMIPYYSQYRDTYLKILPSLKQKFGIQISTKPVFLEQIDLNVFKATQKKHFWVFYDILFGIWFFLSFIIPCVRLLKKPSE
jgi:hypothetical protein